MIRRFYVYGNTRKASLFKFVYRLTKWGSPVIIVAKITAEERDYDGKKLFLCCLLRVATRALTFKSPRHDLN